MNYEETVSAIEAMGRITTVGWFVVGDHPQFDFERMAVRFVHEGGVLDINLRLPKDHTQMPLNTEAEDFINRVMGKLREQGSTNLDFQVGRDCDIVEAVNLLRSSLGPKELRVDRANSDWIAPTWFL